MTALAALCGAGVGLGLVLLAAGWRGTTVSRFSGGWLAARLWGERAVARLGAAVGAAVAVGAVTGWPVGAVLAGLAGWSLPRLLAGGRVRAAEVARFEAVAGWAEMLRDTLAGAAGLEQAIVATAPVAPAAIRGPVMALAVRLERDRLAPALQAFADELADPTGDLVVAALLVAAGSPAGRLGQLLGALAATAREQATLRLRIEAGRARTRAGVQVIVAVTCALAVGLAVLNRGYLTPYDSPTGQLVLAGVGALFAVAFGWLARLARPTAPPRLLLTGPLSPPAAPVSATATVEGAR